MPHRQVLDWTVDDLHRLLRAQEQENLVLEYKASMAIGEWTDSRRNELAKDVSAFANSAGGMIVVGIGEVEHKPTVLDDGVDTRKVSKEAVESALRSRVSPRIEGLIIKEIPNPKRPFHSYFILRVPRSMRAPHMCEPFHRYYRRYNFECVPMEHYELEDIRRRQSEPQLTVTCELSPTGETLADGRHQYMLNAGVLNEGTVTARDVLVRLYVPRVFIGEVTWSPNHTSQPAQYGDLDAYRFDAYVRDGAGPIPIYPHDDQPYLVTRGKSNRITLHLPERDDPALQDAQIVAQLFADNMRMRSFEVAIQELLGDRG